jgi:hypothetical protein
MALSCQKHLFRLDPAAHYLNGAYFRKMEMVISICLLSLPLQPG